MFGMGFGEIVMIAIIAVLFLGPDKLPSTMVEIAKFFRSVKSTVNSARATIEEEMRLSEIKEEVMSYKKDLTSASAELERMASVTEVGSELASIQSELDFNSISQSNPPAPKEPEVITFTPKNKAPETPKDSPTTEGNA